MLKLIAFVDRRFGDGDRPIGWDAWNYGWLGFLGFWGWLGVLLFGLLISAVGVYVLVYLGIRVRHIISSDLDLF